MDYMDYAKKQLLANVVWKRCGGRCVYCGIEMKRFGWKVQRPMNAFTLDHVLPRSKGGTNSVENMVGCCHACNTRKGDEFWKPLNEK